MRYETRDRSRDLGEEVESEAEELGFGSIRIASRDA